MIVEVVTNIMIQNPGTKEVVIQNRKRKYPGWCFPGGHVERGESIYDCAVREVKEETGLDISELELCGVLHWINRENDERYICFMYKTTKYSGELIAENDEGEYFWLGIDELLAAPKENLSKFQDLHFYKWGFLILASVGVESPTEVPMFSFS